MRFVALARGRARFQLPIARRGAKRDLQATSPCRATATDTINLARLLGGLGSACSAQSDKDASHPQRIPMRKVEPSGADEAAKC